MANRAGRTSWCHFHPLFDGRSSVTYIQALKRKAQLPARTNLRKKMGTFIMSECLAFKQIIPSRTVTARIYEIRNLSPNGRRAIDDASPVNKAEAPQM